jgi:hypothetical protein
VSRRRVAALTAVLVLAGCTGAATIDRPPRPTGAAAGPATTRASTGPAGRPATAARPSSPRPSSPPASTSPGPTAGRALALLAALPVKGRAPRTGYTRAAFGPAWTDDNGAAGGHNGCDTRNDILRRDLRDLMLKPGTRGCVVLRGRLADPYTGRLIDFVRGGRTSIAVQIDHVVALSDAWQTGAQQLTPEERIDLANDPRELLAVDGPTNEAKGDGDAATWLPPRRASWCGYVARQIEVKRAYRLWVTPAERDAMRRVLQRCPAGG